MRPVDQLIAHWTAQQLALSEGVTEANIRSFESRYTVRLPGDVRDYFARVNGHVQRGGVDADREGFAFWPLERVEPLPSVCAQFRVPIPLVESPEFYFVFADYLQWSWAYAINLGSTNSTVIFVGATDGKVVAGSFADFVRLYVEDSEALYPKGRTGG